MKKSDPWYFQVKSFNGRPVALVYILKDEVHISGQRVFAAHVSGRKVKNFILEARRESMLFCFSCCAMWHTHNNQKIQSFLEWAVSNSIRAFSKIKYLQSMANPILYQCIVWKQTKHLYISCPCWKWHIFIKICNSCQNLQFPITL